MNDESPGQHAAPRPGEPVTRLGRVSIQTDPPWSKASLGRSDFERLSVVIERHLGVRMGDAKLTMLESRLRSRLRSLDLCSFSEYVERVLEDPPHGEEFELFANLVTTHKTDFFREPGHFRFLEHEALVNLEGSEGVGTTRDLSVWCAACSTGEEAYTLAMVLSDIAARRAQFGFKILATDVSAGVIAHAKRAIYSESQIRPIARDMRTRYLLQSKSTGNDLVRMTKELRNVVQFRQQNLLDGNYRLDGPLDIIFCRNVFIYFERKLQLQILRRFCRCLAPGGYLFLGHAESIRADDLPLVCVGTTTYRKIIER